MQERHDVVYILLLKRLDEGADELDLRGFDGSLASHWNEVIGKGDI